MRLLVPWMTNVDHIILEIADERRTATSTMDVYVNWPTSRAERPTYNHINRRIRKLAENDMLEAVEKRGWYRIGELGDKYLHDPEAEVSDFLPDDEADESDEE
jgi:hypothetical protein